MLLPLHNICSILIVLLLPYLACTFFTMTLIQNLSQKLIYFIFIKYLIIQLKHTFHNVKLYTHIHMRWKVLYEWKKLHPRKRNPGFYIKSSLSPNLLCHSLSVLWEQGLCHLWFIKGREQKGEKKRYCASGVISVLPVSSHCKGPYSWGYYKMTKLSTWQ